MGTGTSSGKGTPTWEQNVDNAIWADNGSSYSFNISGVGGARVRRSGTGFLAEVYTPNSNPTPINGGRSFNTLQDALNTSKKVLKNRRRVQLKSGG